MLPLHCSEGALGWMCIGSFLLVFVLIFFVLLLLLLILLLLLLVIFLFHICIPLWPQWRCADGYTGYPGLRPRRAYGLQRVPF